MAEYEDKILHDIDGIKEYDNPLPGWLMAIWWGSLLFSALYIAFYALSFGEPTMEAEYRSAAEKDLAALQAHFDAHPIVAPTPAELLSGAKNPEVLSAGAARFAKTCASCHGQQAQGLIGPNLTDERWIHGGSVEQIFHSIVKGWPAKGMPPWGRAIPQKEIAALVSYVRSLQGTNPPNAKPAEGEPFKAEALPE
ncbi:MAG: c-type cytochrome [Acidobacteria bacterium]|nr:c-type cytochrome [Acidobacteriota bacterium]MCG3193164.1 Cbb3-type cytochrome c oxidase subunit CcoP2 [Thermoanaerobaculia bacterium]MCK6683422.1 c-type cytochrome [Thermoanaerobaculia bacterium]